MPEQHLFEYAVIRVVPRVEREEFLNVGVILYCPKGKYLQCQITIDEERLRIFCKQLDVEELAKNLYAFEQICIGSPQGGAIARLDAASRFRWLTATRSTVVQTSKVHPGFSTEPGTTLKRLFDQLVA
ncbi:DUF3037 domain-containing protein [Mucilaginibacter daejeonensis]|uniref:DUF3037 domain-containing protein n=1 Tax=Mucilaginibacter daejeonensis TaxID=398049 RepID=UPI001D17785F|nr:DUF3037 domain-containing protein [Mucilaginibacter daejeonensis]UEG52245.1 DUF3037 domain-containing protein [Mucilaginibacter daejeonensis]